MARFQVSGRLDALDTALFLPPSNGSSRWQNKKRKSEAHSNDLRSDVGDLLASLN